MRITIDASRANRPQKTGVEWYSYHLIEELKKITADDGNEWLLYTNDPLDVVLKKAPTNWQEAILHWPPKYLWTQIRLWWELISNPPDVLFVPAHTIPLLPIRKQTKVVVTVHDVGFHRFPELYKPIQRAYHELTMWRIKQRANVIMTISEFSKQEIIECYNIDPQRIVVAPLGYDEQKYKPQTIDSQLLVKYKIAQPYILYTGRIERKKNILNLLEAFKILHERQPQVQLVLVGAPGNAIEPMNEFIVNNKLMNAIHYLGYVSADELPVLVAGAAVYSFVTLYEGFGIPIVEAMASGVPVVTSDMNPHHEVAGAAALLVDPHNPQVIAEALAQIITQPELAERLKIAGLAQSQRYKWSQTAATTLAVLKN
ncbi:MAG: glycosyltransferase family 4 protein [Candidatus Buchananbacteria bacterium]|nr:glycosyltransferase family 4 protein [Candidatus Buchananbacteria bacterium]